MSNSPLRIFVGYDSSELIAYHVCCDSILKHSSIPVSFTPIGLINKPPIYKRVRGNKDSTEFAIIRFLVPWFCDFKGIALFFDGDMVVRGDVAELVNKLDASKAVSVVKHNYTPRTHTKFLNQAQTAYDRKNWRSVMLFNNRLCTELSLDYGSGANGLDLHQFRWLEEEQIGELSPDWNHLVGEYPKSDSASNLHYTLGGPYFEDYKNCDHADDWQRASNEATVPLKLFPS